MGRGKGSSLTSAFLTPKPPASSVCACPRGSSPSQTLDVSDVPFPLHDISDVPFSLPLFPPQCILAIVLASLTASGVMDYCLDA